MGEYSLEYMQQNFKVGFADTLGSAWWDSVGADGAPGFTYPGAVPLDVARGMLDWTPEKRALMSEADDGSAVPLKKSWGKTPVAITRSDTGALVGIMDESYPNSSFAERLLDGLSGILDDSDLSIGSVLLLDGGAKASVQITTGNLTTAGDDDFRLWLAAYSSMDGSLKTTFKRGATRIQCDNTFDMFTREGGAKYSYKNTANSALVIADAREALDIFTDMSEDLTQTVEQMVDGVFSDSNWSALLDALVPTTDSKGEEKKGASKTNAENKRMDLTGMWTSDPRVSKFYGTQWGAFQAFSTHNQHETTVEGADNEIQRNARKMLTGKTGEYDRNVMSAVHKISVGAAV